jgi:hypothetical protein
MGNKRSSTLSAVPQPQTRLPFRSPLACLGANLSVGRRHNSVLRAPGVHGCRHLVGGPGSALDTRSVFILRFSQALRTWIALASCSARQRRAEEFLADWLAEQLTVGQLLAISLAESP